jgi:hypothetical protein
MDPSEGSDSAGSRCIQTIFASAALRVLEETVAALAARLTHADAAEAAVAARLTRADAAEVLTERLCRTDAAGLSLSAKVTALSLRADATEAAVDAIAGRFCRTDAAGLSLAAEVTALSLRFGPPPVVAAAAPPRSQPAQCADGTREEARPCDLPTYDSILGFAGPVNEASLFAVPGCAVAETTFDVVLRSTTDGAVGIYVSGTVPDTEACVTYSARPGKTSYERAVCALFNDLYDVAFIFEPPSNAPAAALQATMLVRALLGEREREQDTLQRAAAAVDPRYAVAYASSIIAAQDAGRTLPPPPVRGSGDKAAPEALPPKPPIEAHAADAPPALPVEPDYRFFSPARDTGLPYASDGRAAGDGSPGFDERTFALGQVQQATLDGLAATQHAAAQISKASLQIQLQREARATQDETKRLFGVPLGRREGAVISVLQLGLNPSLAVGLVGPDAIKASMLLTGDDLVLAGVLCTLTVHQLVCLFAGRLGGSSGIQLRLPDCNSRDKADMQQFEPLEGSVAKAQVDTPTAAAKSYSVAQTVRAMRAQASLLQAFYGVELGNTLRLNITKLEEKNSEQSGRFTPRWMEEDWYALLSAWIREAHKTLAAVGYEESWTNEELEAKLLARGYAGPLPRWEDFPDALAHRSKARDLELARAADAALEASKMGKVRQGAHRAAGNVVVSCGEPTAPVDLKLQMAEAQAAEARLRTNAPPAPPAPPRGTAMRTAAAPPSTPAAGTRDTGHAGQARDASRPTSAPTRSSVTAAAAAPRAIPAASKRGIGPEGLDRDASLPTLKEMKALRHFMRATGRFEAVKLPRGGDACKYACVRCYSHDGGGKGACGGSAAFLHGTTPPSAHEISHFPVLEMELVRHGGVRSGPFIPAEARAARINALRVQRRAAGVDVPSPLAQLPYSAANLDPVREAALLTLIAPAQPTAWLAAPANAATLAQPRALTKAQDLNDAAEGWRNEIPATASSRRWGQSGATSTSLLRRETMRAVDATRVLVPLTDRLHCEVANMCLATFLSPDLASTALVTKEAVVRAAAAALSRVSTEGAPDTRVEASALLATAPFAAFATDARARAGGLRKDDPAAVIKRPDGTVLFPANIAGRLVDCGQSIARRNGTGVSKACILTAAAFGLRHACGRNVSDSDFLAQIEASAAALESTLPAQSDVTSATPTLATLFTACHDAQAEKRGGPSHDRDVGSLAILAHPVLLPALSSVDVLSLLVDPRTGVLESAQLDVATGDGEAVGCIILVIEAHHAVSLQLDPASALVLGSRALRRAYLDALRNLGVKVRFGSAVGGQALLDASLAVGEVALPAGLALQCKCCHAFSNLPGARPGWSHLGRAGGYLRAGAAQAVSLVSGLLALGIRGLSVHAVCTRGPVPASLLHVPGLNETPFASMGRVAEATGPLISWVATAAADGLFDAQPRTLCGSVPLPYRVSAGGPLALGPEGLESAGYAFLANAPSRVLTASAAHGPVATALLHAVAESLRGTPFECEPGQLPTGMDSIVVSLQSGDGADIYVSPHAPALVCGLGDYAGGYVSEASRDSVWDIKGRWCPIAPADGPPPAAQPVVLFTVDSDLYGALSNAYTGADGCFSFAGTAYSSGEQALMASKAKLFNDGTARARIMASSDPLECRDLGRRVRPFDARVWREAAPNLMSAIAVAKFGQNEGLRRLLLGTGTAALGATLPRDDVWGTGLSTSDPRAAIPELWVGANVLGRALSAARAELAARTYPVRTCTPHTGRMLTIVVGTSPPISLRAGDDASFPAPLGEPLGHDPPGEAARLDPAIQQLAGDLVTLQRTAPAKPSPAWLQAAVRACSALVHACGSVEAADHVHKAVWAERVGSSLSASRLDVFEPFLTKGHLYWNRVVASRGADMQFKRGVRRRRKCREPVADDGQRALLWNGIWGDFIEGRALLLASDTAYLASSPDAWPIPRAGLAEAATEDSNAAARDTAWAETAAQLDALGTTLEAVLHTSGVFEHQLIAVEKRNEHGEVDTSKIRCVHNQSEPCLSAGYAEADFAHSLNGGSSKYWFPRVVLPRVLDLVFQLTRLRLWHPFAELSVKVVDVDAAFRRIPVRSRDVALNASRIGGVVVVYQTLTFGGCGSPGVFHAFSSAPLTAYHRGHRPVDPRWHGDMAFFSETLVDDGALVTPKLGVLEDLSETCYLNGLYSAFGLRGLNTVKDLTQGAWGTTNQIWGITIDTVQGTLGMSSVRLARAARYLAEPTWRWGSKNVTVHDMQRLFGSVRWYAQVCRPMANALSDIRRMLSTDDPTGRWVSPRGSPEHKNWCWAQFWDSCELLRVALKDEELWRAPYISTFVGAIPPEYRLCFPDQLAQVVVLGGDAMPSMLFAIDWSSKEAFYHPWTTAAQLALEEVLVGTGVARDDLQETIIAIQELMWAVVAFARSCAAGVSGRVHVAVIDNAVADAWIRKRRATNAYAAHLLRIVSRHEHASKNELWSVWVSSSNNDVADMGSRLVRLGAHEQIEGHDELVAYLATVDPTIRLVSAADAFNFYVFTDWASRSLQLHFESAACFAADVARARGLEREPTQLSLSGVGYMDLGAGAGAIASAAAAFGASVLLVADSDPVARYVLQQRFHGQRTRVVGDVRGVNWQRALEPAICAQVKAAAISFDQTPFSAAGTHLGTETEAAKVAPWAVANVLGKLPNLLSVLLLAVVGMEAVDNGSALTQAVEAFAAIGFRVSTFTVAAAEHGDPQAQRRLVVLAERADVLEALGRPDHPQRRPSDRCRPISSAMSPAGRGQVDDVVQGHYRAAPGPDRGAAQPRVAGFLTVDSGDVVPVYSAVRVGRTVTPFERSASAGGVLYLDAAAASAESPEGVARYLRSDECWAAAGLPDWLLKAWMAKAAAEGASVPAPTHYAVRKLAGGSTGAGAAEAIVALQLGRVSDFERGMAAAAPAGPGDGRAGALRRPDVQWAAPGWLDAGGPCVMRAGGPGRIIFDVTTEAGYTFDERRRTLTSEEQRTMARGRERLAISSVAGSTLKKYGGCWDRYCNVVVNVLGSTVGPILEGRDVRAEENLLLDVLVYYADVKGYAASTIGGYLSAIRWVHVANGFEDPMQGKPRLALARRAVKRLKGGSAGKLPVSPDMLRAIKKTLDFRLPKDVMLWGGLMLAYFFLLRSSEYAASSGFFDVKRALLVGDVEFFLRGQPVEDWHAADELVVCIRASKTDQTRIGVLRNVYATGKDLCPVWAAAAVMDLRRRCAADEPLLQYGPGRVLDRADVSGVLKACALAMGQEAANFASHSLRIGGASCMLACGYSEEYIRRQGRWHSFCWRRYAYDSRDQMQGVSTAMASSAYTVMEAAQDFLARRRTA